jgi:hypothetical protein
MPPLTRIDALDECCVVRVEPNDQTQERCPPIETVLPPALKMLRHRDHRAWRRDRGEMVDGPLIEHAELGIDGPRALKDLRENLEIEHRHGLLARQAPRDPWKQGNSGHDKPRSMLEPAEPRLRGRPLVAGYQFTTDGRLSRARRPDKLEVLQAKRGRQGQKRIGCAQSRGSTRLSA